MTNAASQDLPPVPVSERRDDIGRLVAMTWHRDGPVMTADGRRWLVAVDGSECSLRAVAIAARLVAAAGEGEVDLVHVQPWLVKESAETELPRRAWEATAAARQALEAASVRWRLHVEMGEAAARIVNLSDVLDSRGIVIGSHGLTATESLFLGSVAYKVVQLGNRPVLIGR
jgi:nucleotide-binding universal stress UspA family protein